MREPLILAIHPLVTLVKLLRPGGLRAVVAESLLLKHQILISNRSRRRAPNLTTLDRCVLGLTALFLSPRRIPKLGALIKPAMRLCQLVVEICEKADEKVIGAKVDQVCRSDCRLQAAKLTPLCEAAAHDLSVIPSCQ
jgi:hypothetical protein